MKFCKKCNREREKHEFYKVKKKKDGSIQYDTVCRYCRISAGKKTHRYGRNYQAYVLAERIYGPFKATA